MASLCHGALVSTEKRLLVNLYLMKMPRPIAAMVRGYCVGWDREWIGRSRRCQNHKTTVTSLLRARFRQPCTQSRGVSHCIVKSVLSAATPMQRQK